MSDAEQTEQQRHTLSEDERYVDGLWPADVHAAWIERGPAHPEIGRDETSERERDAASAEAAASRGRRRRHCSRRR